MSITGVSRSQDRIFVLLPERCSYVCQWGRVTFPDLISGFRKRMLNGQLAGLRTRQGRSTRVRESSYEVTPSRSDGAGDGRRIVRRPASSRQPDIGSGRPRVWASAGVRAQVRVDLTGDVPLQAADDLGLGFSFLGAAIASVARVSAIGHVSPAFRSIPAGLVHKSAHTIGGRQVVTPEAAWTRRPGAA